MYGFPKVFSTKQDFYNVKEQFPNETKEALKKILNGRFVWEEEKKLTSKTEGVNDSTHKVLVNTDEEGKTVISQLRYVEDPHCELFRLGFTVEEAKTFIEGD